MFALTIKEERPIESIPDILRMIADIVESGGEHGSFKGEDGNVAGEWAYKAKE